MNKKGIAPIVIIVTIASILLGAYILINISPNFAVQKIKGIVNYLGIVVLFITIQVLFIYGYYKIGVYIKRGYYIYKNKILKWGFNFKKRVLLTQ